jgi:hypothetical protein
MFCPNCSQQHLPNEVRFCSRCGFNLAAVSQLFNNNGMNFVQPAVSKEKLPLIKRQEIRTGAKLIFASFFLFVPCLILAGIFDSGLPLVLIPLTFLLGLAQIIYYFFFGESILPLNKQNQSFELSENTYPYNFQPTNNLPFSFMDSHGVNTNEFIPRESVTKKTSNLFNGR